MENKILWTNTEKKICKRCKRYGYNRGVLYCKATAKTLTHWSTGELEVVYDKCDAVNVDGKCSMYVYQPTVWESIRPWFADFNWIAWLILAVFAAALVCLHYKILECK